LKILNKIIPINELSCLEEKTFFQIFENMEDPRDNRWKIYPLIDILILALYGVLIGFSDFTNMSYYLKKAAELFGNNFNKKFPQEGTSYLLYDEQNNLYYAEEISLDQQEDSFYINKIQKQKNGYEVEMIEYIEDYTQELEQGSHTIIVRNRIENSVLEENAELKTTKSDKECHGIGIQSIKEIVTRYNGMMEYYEKDMWFTASIWLPQKIE